MAKVHGKNTVVTVDSNDLSAFANTSEFNLTADSHDTTTYGQGGHVFSAGLTNGTFTLGGIYDNTVSTGPRAVLQPLVGADPVPVTRQPEGAGAGKPEDSFSGQLTSYTETSPVADMVTWSAEFQVSGSVTTSVQV